MKKLYALNRTILVLLILMLYASSCSQGITTEDNSPRLSSTSIVTPTFISAAAVETRPAYPEQMNKSCWKTQASSNQEENGLGSILYYSSELNAVVAFNMASYHTKIIKDANSLIDISPDKNTISYHDPRNKDVKFISSFSNTVFSVPEDLYSDGFFGNNTIRLGVAGALERNYLKNEGTKDEYYLLSTDIGKPTFYTVFLPYFVDPGYGHSYAKYSFDLRYIVYPAYYVGSYKIILLDKESGKIIWSGWEEGFPVGRFPSLLPPIWKPDSSAVTIVANDKLTGAKNIDTVSVDGKISELTHLEQVFDLPYQIGLLVWSPDGRYLALRIDFDSKSMDPLKNNMLYIYDSQTGNLINTCLSLGNDLTHPIEYPVWSPNGNQLAVLPVNKPGMYTIDLGHEKIHQLRTEVDVSSANLLGWVSWEIP